MVFPFASSSKQRSRLALYPPASPRVARDHGHNSMFPEPLLSHRWNRILYFLLLFPVMYGTVPENKVGSICRSLAFCSLEEATSSIALVICMVLSTLLIRSFTAFIFAAIGSSFFLYLFLNPRIQKAFCINFQSAFQLLFCLFFQFSGLLDRLHHFRSAGIGIQPGI